MIADTNPTLWWRPLAPQRAASASATLAAEPSPVTAPRQSVAVAVFRNLSGLPADDWLATALAELGRATAWVALDSDDNDLTRFLTVLVAALDQLAPGVMLAADQLTQVLAAHQPDRTAQVRQAVQLEERLREARLGEVQQRDERRLRAVGVDLDVAEALAERALHLAAGRSLEGRGAAALEVERERQPVNSPAAGKSVMSPIRSAPRAGR